MPGQNVYQRNARRIADQERRKEEKDTGLSQSQAAEALARPQPAVDKVSPTQKKPPEWDSAFESSLSRPLYSMLVAVFMIFGLVFLAAIAWAGQALANQLTIWFSGGLGLLWILIFLLLVGFAIYGYQLASAAATPATSLIGYSFVVAPFAFLLFLISPWNLAGHLRVTFVLAGMLVPLGLLGWIVSEAWEVAIVYPLSWAAAAMVEIFLLPYLKQSGMELGVTMTPLGWLIVALISLYLTFVWYRAMDAHYTLDNAVDGSLGVYMNVIKGAQLFLKGFQGVEPVLNAFGAIGGIFGSIFNKGGHSHSR